MNEMNDRRPQPPVTGMVGKRTVRDGIKYLSLQYGFMLGEYEARVSMNADADLVGVAGSTKLTLTLRTGELGMYYASFPNPTGETEGMATVIVKDTITALFAEADFSAPPLTTEQMAEAIALVIDFGNQATRMLCATFLASPQYAPVEAMVLANRMEQMKKWPVEHDDAHSHEEMLEHVQEWLDKAKAMKGPHTPLTRLARVGALVIATMERLVRKGGAQ